MEIAKALLVEQVLSADGLVGYQAGSFTALVLDIERLNMVLSEPLLPAIWHVPVNAITHSLVQIGHVIRLDRSIHVTMSRRTATHSTLALPRLSTL